MLSCEPPGVNGQTMRTVRWGQSSPWANAVSRQRQGSQNGGELAPFHTLFLLRVTLPGPMMHDDCTRA